MSIYENLFQAFSSLAEAAYESADTADEIAEPETFCLSSSFETIVQRLLDTTDRYVFNLREISAYTRFPLLS